MECTHYIGVLIVLGTNCCVFKSANVPLIQIKILKIYCRSNNRVKIVIKRHLYDWGRGRGQLYLKAKSDVNVFCAKEKNSGKLLKRFLCASMNMAAAAHLIDWL